VNVKGSGMQEETLIIGGYLSQVTFGRTFVVLEGFSSHDNETIEWWLRLGKEFSVSCNDSDHQQDRVLDVSEARLSAAADLINSCGSTVSRFSVSDSDMSMHVGAVRIEMSWNSGDIACAQLDVRHVDCDGSAQQSYSISIPQD
jgi:hypothetical protein